MQLNLTPRDDKVLIQLYYNRYMSSCQIAELFYKYKTDGTPNIEYERIARRRLQNMVSNLKLVNEFIPYAKSKKVYGLSERGVGYVCSMLGIKYNDYQRKENYLDLSFMRHSIEINDFYINLIEYAQSHAGTIKMFLVERHNRRTFIYNNKKLTFQPDVFLIYNNKAFYIELDRGTETPKKYAQKIPVYEAFYHNEILKEEWQPKSPVYPSIVTLCDTQERIKKLQTETKLKWFYVLKNDWSWLE